MALVIQFLEIIVGSVRIFRTLSFCLGVVGLENIANFV